MRFETSKLIGLKLIAVRKILKSIKVNEVSIDFKKKVVKVK